jgi:hypothetical protein
MEEKEARKGVDKRPMKSSCRCLEEGSKGMILLPKSTPMIRGPSKKVGKVSLQIGEMCVNIFGLFLL